MLLFWAAKKSHFLWSGPKLSKGKCKGKGKGKGKDKDKDKGKGKGKGKGMGVTLTKHPHPHAPSLLISPLTLLSSLPSTLNPHSHPNPNP